MLRLGGICALFVSLYGADALACSCGFTSLTHVVPGDGSTGVPTNVVFLLGVTVRRQSVELRDASGAVVETFKSNPATARFTPATPLAPNATYSLHFIPGPDEEGAARRVSTFTTGAGADTTPPSLDDFDFTWTFTPGPPPCEDHLFQTVFGLTMKGAADEATPATQLSFDAFVGDTASSVDLTQAAVVMDQPASIREVPCDVNLPGVTARAGLAVSLVAVDWAGNRSARTATRVLKANGKVTGTGSGCTAAGGTDASILTAFLVLACAGVLRRRTAG